MDNKLQPLGPDNRRSHIRLQRADAIPAQIRIVRLADRGVRLRPGLIGLLDLSPGGCGFYSSLRFPAGTRLLCMVEWRTGEEHYQLLGRIRWRRREENGYRYGFAFQAAAGERLRLHRSLNRMLLELCPGQGRIHRLYREQAGTVRRTRLRQ
jgi:hypothetical protein